MDSMFLNTNFRNFDNMLSDSENKKDEIFSEILDLSNIKKGPNHIFNAKTLFAVSFNYSIQILSVNCY
jgi:hypothetical protein